MIIYNTFLYSLFNVFMVLYISNINQVSVLNYFSASYRLHVLMQQKQLNDTFNINDSLLLSFVSEALIIGQVRDTDSLDVLLS